MAVKRTKIPSKSTVRRHLKALRALIDTSKDPLLRRVAYSMETAVRWATEPTADWPGLVEEAQLEAETLKGELMLDHGIIL